MDNHPNFELIRHDVTIPISLEGQNMASCMSCITINYCANPIKTSKQVFLEHTICCRRGNARFLMASTSEIYGNPEVHPQPETYRISKSYWDKKLL